MFRRIVTELAYSPALASGLNVYIRKLRREEAKRQIGLIFVILAVLVQLFATTLPPESANASNPTAFIDTGIESHEHFLGYYDQNTESVRDLFTALSISREDVKSTTEETIEPTSDLYYWSMQSSRDTNDTIYHFSTTGGLKTAYYRPLSSQYTLTTNQRTPLWAYVGSSAQLGWFGILQGTGNLVTKSPAIAACTSAESTSAPTCIPPLELSLSSRNMSTKLPEASASDHLMYSLQVKNVTSDRMAVPISINLEDVLEYSQILDRGGGNLDLTTRILTWPQTTLAAGEQLSRSFIVQIMPEIPSTARGQHITASYDCVISASFGNSVSTPINCPPAKYIEKVVSSLPPVSPSTNILFALALLGSTLYFYMRARQLLTELYIIRHNQPGGV